MSEFHKRNLPSIALLIYTIGIAFLIFAPTTVFFSPPESNSLGSFLTSYGIEISLAFLGITALLFFGTVIKRRKDVKEI